MFHPEGTEGTNHPFTPPAEVASRSSEQSEEASEAITELTLPELEGQLQTEKQARFTAETKIAEINGTLAEKDARITELVAATVEKDSLIATLNQSVADATTLHQSLQDAISAYKATTIKANPNIPAELITGDTIEAIAQSLESAKTLISKVRQSIEAEIASGKVPAGAPARTAPDLDSLSPREKIQYAITKGGKT